MRRSWIALCMTVALAGGACSSQSGTKAQRTIPQPSVSGIEVASGSRRVDLAVPTFSDPTTIDNPLFPVSRQESVVLLGTVEGKHFRTEVTLLPDTRIIEWQGQKIETLISQYTAYLDGRIEEVAYDYYAQDDIGAVWYFGEDVFNFRDGVIADTHGTWLAGKDGPAAMIMPAEPRVGDVYRPENIPGLVFEEVTVKATNEQLRGPFGTIEGGLVIRELHMDGGTEEKSFAPARGEFYTAGGGDVEALAFAVPADAASGPMPAELTAIVNGAVDLLDAARTKRWNGAAATISRTSAAWTQYRTTGVPTRLEPVMTKAIAALRAGVAKRDAEVVASTANDVAQLGLDLQLRHRPVVEVDLARLGLWAARIQVDTAAGDVAATNGDALTLDYIRDRILHALDAVDVVRINATLEELQTGVTDGEAEATEHAARTLRELASSIRPRA